MEKSYTLFYPDGVLSCQFKNLPVEKMEIFTIKSIQNSADNTPNHLWFS